MNNTWKIYMLTLISFLVGTSLICYRRHSGSSRFFCRRICIGGRATYDCILARQCNRHPARHPGSDEAGSTPPTVDCTLHFAARHCLHASSSRLWLSDGLTCRSRRCDGSVYRHGLRDSCTARASRKAGKGDVQRSYGVQCCSGLWRSDWPCCRWSV